MNKKQWFTLGIGLIIFGNLLLAMTIGSYCTVEEISCYIRRYAYAIPGLILTGLGVLFIICAFLESKRKD